MHPAQGQHRHALIPPAWRWAALAWVAIWAPTYAATWGWRNFFALCDVAVALTCVGIWLQSARLLSAQVLVAVMAGVLWAADAGGRLLTGRHLFGGTEYMWMHEVPLAVRLLSLFHLVLPVALVAALRRTGYDRRGLSLQVALTAVLLVVSRVVGAAKNLNFAFREPLLHRQWGPVPLHLLAVLAGITLLYLPTHVVLSRRLPRAP